MEPATGWGVHGGPCVDTLRSVEVKVEELEKTILCELEDGSPFCQYGLVKYLHMRSCYTFLYCRSPYMCPSVGVKYWLTVCCPKSDVLYFIKTVPAYKVAIL